MHDAEHASTAHGTDSHRLMIRAELYHCLAQAFAPPMESAFHAALTGDLPADLDELLPGRGAGIELASAMGTVPTHQDLLRSYSRLFLVPPRPVSLNASVHIDGSIMGPTAVAIETCYQRHGMPRDVAFRGTPDHLSLQLRFLALLLVSAVGTHGQAQLAVLEEARDFLHRFLRPWVGELARSLTREAGNDPRARPYAVLGQLTHEAVESDGRWLLSHAPVPATAASDMSAAVDSPSPQRPLGDQTHTPCTNCGTPFAAPSELANMIRVLEERGLDAAHLSVCPDCRAGTMGLQPTNPHFKEVSRGFPAKGGTS